MPPPYQSRSVDNSPEVVSRPVGARLYLPPGFHIEPWATGLVNPRFLTVAPNGDVFVSESRANRVTILRESDGRVQRYHFATALRQPFGIAFYPPGPDPQYIYIANTSGILRFPYRNGDVQARGAGEHIATLTPGGYNQHWTRTIIFSPDGKKMYVSVGSRSDVGEEEPPRSAVTEFNPDGSGKHTYATGLRNTVGLAFNPVSGALWGVINERDHLGDDVPFDYATSLKPGGFYGWPYYYIGAHRDPRMPEKPELAKQVIIPDVLLEPHCAPLGIAFYTGTQFPASYRNDAFVTMHGSWNRSRHDGYKVVRIPMNTDGTAQGYYEDFVWGWKTKDDEIWGRPVAVAGAHDGALLITDDGGDLIWRVSYRAR